MAGFFLFKFDGDFYEESSAQHGTIINGQNNLHADRPKSIIIVRLMFIEHQCS